MFHNICKTMIIYDLMQWFISTTYKDKKIIIFYDYQYACTT